MLAVLLLLAACAADRTSMPSPSREPSTPARPVAGPLEPVPPVEGLPFDDPRLAPVIAELVAHPEWLDEPLEEAVVLALVPGVDHLCLALRGTEDGDIFVSVADGRPWSVAAVGLDRGDEGRQFTYDPDGMADDACTFVIFGRRDPWPASAAGVKVTGAVAGDEAVAIAQAAYARPADFGIDLHGVPEVVVHDLAQPTPEGWRCWQAVVFVGGPRADLVVGTRQPPGGGWEVTPRLTAQALRDAVPRQPDAC